MFSVVLLNTVSENAAVTLAGRLFYARGPVTLNDIGSDMILALTQRLDSKNK